MARTERVSRQCPQEGADVNIPYCPTENLYLYQERFRKVHLDLVWRLDPISILNNRFELWNFSLSFVIIINMTLLSRFDLEKTRLVLSVNGMSFRYEIQFGTVYTRGLHHF